MTVLHIRSKSKLTGNWTLKFSNLPVGILSILACALCIATANPVHAAGAAGSAPSIQPVPTQPAPSQDKPVPKTQVYNGTIVKDGTSYVLRASSGAVYRLDDQTKAARFDSKSVRVTGKLDDTTKLLHVENISEMGA